MDHATRGANRQYGRSFADVYDDWYGDLDNPADLIGMLERLGTGRRVLELGVGTGRLALPLRDAGYAVTGIDASMAMLAQMAARTNHLGPDAIAADMTSLPFDRARFDVALIAYNTLFNLPSQSAQQRCLAECSRVLTVGGILAIDTFVPSAAPAHLTHTVSPGRSTDRDVVLIGTRQHGGSTAVDGVHMQFDQSGLIPRPWTVHTATPEQIDEAAAQRGLRLHQRCADWRGGAFTSDASRHVSVYRNDGVSTLAAP